MIIFFFILVNFRKFGITLVVMASMSLCLFGAVVGLRIADFTIGLTSVLGFITLLGMIVRNVILMYQHAEDKRKVCHWVGTPGGLRRRQAAHGADLPHDRDHGRRRRADDVRRQYFLGAGRRNDLRRRHRLADPRSHDPARPLFQNLQMMKKTVLFLLLCMAAAPGLSQTLTLDECRAAAEEHNRTLKNSRLDLDAALQTRREAFTTYFPQVSASGGVFQAQHGLVQADFAIPQMGSLPLSLVKRGILGSVTAVQPCSQG